MDLQPSGAVVGVDSRSTTLRKGSSVMDPAGPGSTHNVATYLQVHIGEWSRRKQRDDIVNGFVQVELKYFYKEL